MKSTKFLSGIAAARARLVLLAATFVVAISLVAPAAASLQNPLVVSAQSGALSQGTAGSATYIVTVNRSGGTPATATMSVSGLPAGATGAFGTPSAWTPATGTGSQTVTLTVTTTAAATAGVRTLTVSAAATGSQTRSGTGTLTITGPQTITFGALPAKIFGNPDFNVSATATSGLPVSFAASGNCSVTGTLVHLTGAGSCTITASQAGNATWNPAPNVAQTFPIAPSSQTITFNPLIGKYLGDSDFNLSATASSNLAVSFAVATGDCTVSGNRVHLTGSAAGSCTITASQAGDANYNAATSVDQTFAIAVFTGIELYAVTGTATLPGQSVPVWGYSYTDAPVIQPGGPALTFNLNDPVTIRLHNQLAETTSLLFQGQDMIPDTTGVPPMETKVYSFTATRPGTYLYEAGLLPKAQHQPAMGLYGALVVRSATAGQAYDSAATAFDSDAVLLLSEIDPVLNGNPAAFDMRDFAPRYFLINGKAYPSTDPIPGAAGTKVLLRYVNAGVQHHSMATLGLTQDLIAQDGNALLFPGKRVAETVAPGKTMDTIVTLPATVSTDSRYAVYDGRLMLHNNGAPGFGGMLTFVTATGTSTGDTIGPATTAVVLTSTSVSATVSDVATGNSNVTAAEFFVDTTGANGTGTAMVGAFGVPTVNVERRACAHRNPQGLRAWGGRCRQLGTVPVGGDQQRCDGTHDIGPRRDAEPEQWFGRGRPVGYRERYSLGWKQHHGGRVLHRGRRRQRNGRRHDRRRRAADRRSSDRQHQRDDSASCRCWHDLRPQHGRAWQLGSARNGRRPGRWRRRRSGHVERERRAQSEQRCEDARLDQSGRACHSDHRERIVDQRRRCRRIPVRNSSGQRLCRGCRRDRLPVRAQRRRLGRCE